MHSTVSGFLSGVVSKVGRRLGRSGGSGADASGADDRGRVHADRDDEFVVFLVGMRINAFWKVHRWLPVFLFGPRLVAELDGDAGLLGSWTFLDPPRTIGFVQYWDSAESLRAYAHDDDRSHTDAWQTYAARSDDRAVGIWHETYRVDAHETVYDGVGPRGLGAARGSDLVPATGELVSAAGRMGTEATAGEMAGDEDTPAAND